MAAVIVSSAVRVGVSWAKCRRDTLAMMSQHLGQHDFMRFGMLELLGERIDKDVKLVYTLED